MRALGQLQILERQNARRQSRGAQWRRTIVRLGSAFLCSADDRTKECPHIRNVELRNLVGREVTTVVVRLPVNDVRVIALREAAKPEEVAAEPGESQRHGRRCGWAWRMS